MKIEKKKHFRTETERDFHIKTGLRMIQDSGHSQFGFCLFIGTIREEQSVRSLVKKTIISHKKRTNLTKHSQSKLQKTKWFQTIEPSKNPAQKSVLIKYVF